MLIIDYQKSTNYVCADSTQNTIARKIIEIQTITKTRERKNEKKGGKKSSPADFLPVWT